ncbi:MAG: HAD-IIB family hydrolase [Planctomycetota bacterium]
MPALFSDVDGTLLGDDELLTELRDALEPSDVTLVLNSSRPVPSLLESLANVPHLPRPKFIIGAMGTQIAHADDKLIDDFNEVFGSWSRDPFDALADELGLARHDEKYQTPLKASFDISDGQSFDDIRRLVEQRGLDAKLVHSGGDDIDFLPPGAGKLTAIGFLCVRLALDPRRGEVAVAGDSGNDIDMFDAPLRGIVVANAEDALKTAAPAGEFVYHAQRRMAGGVLDGLRHFGLL